jgi:hypothetical protein
VSALYFHHKGAFFDVLPQKMRPTPEREYEPKITGIAP